MYLIMKNILNKVYLHPLFLLTTFIFILIGRFRFVCYFMLLIITHELGHIIISLIFKWKIEKVIILPFGGVIIYDIKLNTPLIQEFLVSISGVIFQYIFYIIFLRFIEYKYFDYINYFIIMFNLLPIYPLDGSKIFEVILNKIICYRRSLFFVDIVSFILLFVLFIYMFSINKLLFIVVVLLLTKVISHYKNIDIIYNKYLLERHMYIYKFKKIIIINSIKKFKKDYLHLLKIGNKYMNEKRFLNKYFLNNK